MTETPSGTDGGGLALTITVLLVTAAGGTGALVTEPLDASHHASVDEATVQPSPARSQGTAASTGGNGGADIVTVDIFWDPREPEAGDAMEFFANVTNEGTTATGSFRLAFNVGGPEGPGTIDNVSVSNLDPGQHRIVDSVPWNATEGNHTIEVLADVANEVDETNETNNDRRETFTVEASAGEPNLSVTEISAPANLTDGDTTRFTAEISNIGDATAGPSNASFLLDSELRLGNALVPGLEPGERVWVDSESWNATGGTHNLTVTADVHDDVAESDETDNQEAQLFEVAEELPELTGGVQVRDSPVQIGEPVEVQYSVTNEGQAAAGPFDVVFRVDRTVVEHQRIDGLHPRVGILGVLSIDQPLEAGVHRVTMEIDADREVDESDEQNNLAVDRFLVVVPPDPAVTDLTLAKENLRTDAAEGPANPIAGQAISVHVADLSDAVLEAPVELTVTACPEEAAGPLPSLSGGCETVGQFLLEPEAVEEGLERSTTWDTLGKAGDWTVCAELTVDREQRDETNDERCQETFVAVGGTGLGGVEAG